MKWRKLFTAPRENPSDTLIRYAMAIDDHYDPETASDAQAIDLQTLIDAVQSVKDAQQRQLSCTVTNVRVGIAMGLCEKYMELYGITPPPPPR